MAATLLPPSPVDTNREALAALAASCAHRHLIHTLTMSDLQRWDEMSTMEQRTALTRARRRVEAVVPQPVLAL